MSTTDEAALADKGSSSKIEDSLEETHLDFEEPDDNDEENLLDEQEEELDDEDMKEDDDMDEGREEERDLMDDLLPGGEKNNFGEDEQDQAEHVGAPSLAPRLEALLAAHGLLDGRLTLAAQAVVANIELLPQVCTGIVYICFGNVA